MTTRDLDRLHTFHPDNAYWCRFGSNRNSHRITARGDHNMLITVMQRRFDALAGGIYRQESLYKNVNPITVMQRAFPAYIVSLYNHVNRTTNTPQQHCSIWCQICLFLQPLSIA